MTRNASASAWASGVERLGGAHGALGGAGVRAIATADADEKSASSGLTGADGSVSSVLRLVDERTNYDLACKLTMVSHVMAKQYNQDVPALGPVLCKACC
jgi:hypothetical protein